MREKNLQKASFGALLAMLAGFSQGSLAADYPSRQTTLIVGYAAGGATDLASRLLADKLKVALGQPVVVENRPGAAGHLSFTAAKDAQPDGYTLAVATPAIVALKITSKAYTLDPAKDFTYVAQFVTAADPLLLVARTSAPYKTLGEFVSYARANPGKINFGAVGGVPDLEVSGFAHAAGITVTTVPYKGSAPQQQALAAGEVDVAYDAIVSAKPNLDSNRIRTLAVIGKQRDPAFPGTPTITEVVPGYSRPPFFFGLIGPANLPREVVARLNDGIRKSMNQPDISSRLAPMGMKGEVGSPDDFRALVNGELDRISKIAKLIGMEPQ